MDDVGKQLASASWWFSVVVAGFLVNVVAAYAKPLLDRFAVAYSTGRRAKVDDLRARLDKTVDYLLKNPQEILDLKLDIMTAILLAILFLAFAIFLFPLAEFSIGLAGWSWALSNFGRIAFFFITTVVIMIPVREYFALRRIVSAYRDAAHTVVSRFRSGEFPAA